MSKKAYIMPTMQIVELNQQYSILAGSGKGVTSLKSSDEDSFIFDDDGLGDDEPDRWSNLKSAVGKLNDEEYEEKYYRIILGEPDDGFAKYLVCSRRERI